MSTNKNKTEAIQAFERSIHLALQTYSNVHRGSGHFSRASTHLFEKSREIVLDYLGLSKRTYLVIFCNPRQARMLISSLNPGSYKVLSSEDAGLALGLRAVAVKKQALPDGIPFQTGGGTTRLISRDWVLWAGAPDRFEAGTPSIINVIAFARALLMISKSGREIFPENHPGQILPENNSNNDEYVNISGKDLLQQLRLAHIGRDIRVPTRSGEKRFVNLDNGASTPTFEPIWQTYLGKLYRNNSSSKDVITETRNICSSFLGAPLSSYDLIFTSNTTESINIVAESFGHQPDNDSKTVVLNTLLEHNSNDLPWRSIPDLSLIRLEVDGDGFIYLDELDDLLASYNIALKFGNKRIKLVAVSGASNVLGSYNDLTTICRIAHKNGAKVLVDAAQLVAHRKINMESAGIDYLVFSGHKIYAPFGTGVLVARKGSLNFNPITLEEIISSGEENTAGIAALGKSVRLMQQIGMDVIREEEQSLTRKALQGLAEINGVDVPGINDPDEPRFEDKGGVIVFKLNNTMASVIAKRLAEDAGIGSRYGCHCSHLIVKQILKVKPGLERFQHFLLKLLPKLQLPGIARISIGIENTEEDIHALVAALKDIAAGKKAKGRFNMHEFEKEAEAKIFG